MSAGGTHLKDEGSRWQVVLAGGTAGLISRFCIAPLDVIKIRLQLKTESIREGVLQTRGSVEIVKSIFRYEGIQGFWRGNVSAELLYVTYGAAQFTAYRMTSNVLEPLLLPSSVSSFLSGGLAGAAATMITYPLDLLRTRFAAQGTQRVYTSLLGSLRSIYCEEGSRGFFRGLGVTVGQIVPYMGLFFSTYESFRPIMSQFNLPYGSNDAIAGVMASTISKTAIFPLDLIRRRLQIQGPLRRRFAGGKVPQYGRGLGQVGKAIVLQEGWRGLYRGLSISLIKAAPSGAITMWAYEHVLNMIKKQSRK